MLVANPPVVDGGAGHPPTLCRAWRLLPHDRGACDRLARSLQLSPLVAQLLLNRGVAAPDEARRFLDAPLSGLHPPHLLPGVPEAVDRIFHAVEGGKRL